MDSAEWAERMEADAVTAEAIQAAVLTPELIAERTITSDWIVATARSQP